MAGLVPANHVLRTASKTWMPGTGLHRAGHDDSASFGHHLDQDALTAVPCITDHLLSPLGITVKHSGLLPFQVRQ